MAAAGNSATPQLRNAQLTANPQHPKGPRKEGERPKKCPTRKPSSFGRFPCFLGSFGRCGVGVSWALWSCGVVELTWRERGEAALTPGPRHPAAGEVILHRQTEQYQEPEEA